MPATIADLLGAGYLAHYSTYDLADMWQDTAGTTAVTTLSDQVRRFDSIGGSVTDPLLATNSYAVLEGPHVSGGNRVSFTAALTGRFELTLPSTPVRLGVIAVWSNITVNGTLWTFGGDSGGTYTRGHLVTTPAIQLNSSVVASTTASATSGGTSGTPEAYAWVAGTTETRVMSCLDMDGNKTTNWGTDRTILTVGALRNNTVYSQYASCYLYEILIADMDGVSHTKLLEVATLLRSKWELDDPDPLPDAATGGVIRRRIYSGGQF